MCFIIIIFIQTFLHTICSCNYSTLVFQRIYIQLGNTHYPLVTGGWQMVAAWSLGLCDGALLKEH